jgi:hypothetical protein
MLKLPNYIHIRARECIPPLYAYAWTRKLCRFEVYRTSIGNNSHDESAPKFGQTYMLIYTMSHIATSFRRCAKHDQP